MNIPRNHSAEVGQASRLPCIPNPQARSLRYGDWIQTL